MFHEHNFVTEMVSKDHFFYSFRIMDAMLQSQAASPSSNLKLGPGILRKMIKRTNQVSVTTTHIGSIFSFVPISPTPLSPIILFQVLLSSILKGHMEIQLAELYLHSENNFILFNKPTKLPQRWTCPCMEGLWFPMIQIPKLEWN